jgi:hypothetical protein
MCTQIEKPPTRGRQHGKSEKTSFFEMPEPVFKGQDAEQRQGFDVASATYLIKRLGECLPIDDS